MEEGLNEQRAKEQNVRFMRMFREFLNEHDPVELICIGAPPDEYDPERRTIAPSLCRCQSADDVLAVVPTEFKRWFGRDTAGPRERYRPLANDLWSEMQRYESLF